MSSSNGGPSQSISPVLQPITGAADSSGNVQLYGPGGVAIPTYNPANLVATGGTIGGTSVAAVAAAGVAGFRDDFRRATTAAGTIGGGRTLKGAFVSAFPLPAATGGEIGTFGFTNASGTVVYATRTLRAKPRQLQARWLLHDNATGTDYTTMGMIITSSATNLIDTMLHVTITPFALNFQKRIAGGAFIDLIPQVSISPQLAFDVPHIATITVDGTTARVQIDDAVDVSATDADIATITGPTIVVEHYSPSTSVRYPMTIYEVLTR